VRIVIAAWHLRDFNVGLGRYSRGLIEALGRVDHENRYEILVPDPTDRFPDRPNMRYRLIRFPFFKRRFWEQVSPWLAGPHDLLHLPYDSCVAWKRGKLVTTVHDLKPLLMGTARKGVNLNSLVEHLLVRDKWKRIDHLVTDSECSRRDIEAKLGLAPERVTVVYPGVDLSRFRPTGISSTLDVRGSEEHGGGPSTSNSELRTGPRRPYVLCVAGADPTKNVETLVDAFARLPLLLREGHDLVLVGDFRRRLDLLSRVRQCGVEKQTVFPGVVDDERLIAWYQGATAFVFPSRYEGFGFPVLEAMACGCPVISSQASSLPEVAGEAALLVDPLDPERMSATLAGLLANDELRRDLRQRGLAQAARFSWDRTAQQMVAVYQKVAQG
jgi:glycosyltransferase involved in cell wall biosynthesis